MTGDEPWAQRGDKLFLDSLEVSTRHDHSQAWATVQHNQGTLYARRYERSGAEEHA